jgi:proton-dependent oligopeptide transporter, POT family
VVTSNQAALESSLKTFNTIGWWGVGIGVVFFLLSFVLKKWSYGANDTRPIDQVTTQTH